MTFIAPKKILVTGGAGFIGSNVVKLIQQRYPQTEVRVLHLPKENLINLADVSNIELMAGDITVAEDVARAVNGCDVVIHMAAIYAFWLPDMSLMPRVNVGGARLILEECRKQKVQRLVFTSSAVRFGGQGLDNIGDENSPFTMSGMVYAKSKYDAHVLAEQFAKDGLDVVIVCPSMPIGPGDVGPTPTGSMVTNIFNLPVPLAISSEMNLIDVRDCAMGHLLALEKGVSGESYILGGENYRYTDMLRRVLRIAGEKRRVWEVPTAMLKPVAFLLVALANRTGNAPLMTPSEVDMARKGLVLDTTKARCELGLTIRPLEQSLRDSLRWFAENGYIENARLSKKLASK